MTKRATGSGTVGCLIGVVPWQVVERDSRGTVTGLHRITR
jgi:hypothetical protein